MTTECPCGIQMLKKMYSFPLEKNESSGNTIISKLINRDHLAKILMLNRKSDKNNKKKIN